MTVEELAQSIGATLRLGTAFASPAAQTLTACATLDEASEHDVSFLSNPRYAPALTTTKAGAVVVSKQDEPNLPPEKTALIADDPYFVFRQAVVALHGFRKHGEPGVSSQAMVDPSAKIGEGVMIMPFACVAADAVVGARTVLYPHTFVGPRAKIGADCILFPSVTVYNDCVLGDRVTLHASCVIGQDGFGYATHQGRHQKIPQIGNAVIEDDVELGAGCTIDRATLGSTRIGKGTKFSDLVAIGHGAQIGKHNLFVAQVGIAGSTKTGDYVVMGGQVGVAGHLKIGSMVKIAAKAGVMTDLEGNDDYGGTPTVPLSEAKRQVLAGMKLPEMMKEFRDLKKKVAELEAKLKTK
jgi:UDP-3-O-[3-hydroxymyristoyl] glucosamine N-acyltransferase